ncbi:MAG: alpha-amylase family glycosyl hydrolase, partial [Chthoniobacterales bacterium]
MLVSPHVGRRLVVALLGSLLLAGGQLPSARAEGMLQLFNVSWSEIARKMPELAEAGYGSLWLPPPTKGSGGLSVGYDLWDPYDMGSKDQRNSVRTRYGTEAELLEMVQTAHRFGIRVYFDNIMNHRAFDVPGYNENTPIDVYPGMVPEDFHLQKTADGFYRKWRNTSDWNSAWEVQNLGLADLIDIAHETPNANHGTTMGATHPKYSFIRDFDRPEQYDKDRDGNTAYFGVLIDQARAELGTNATTAQLKSKAQEYINARKASFTEDVGAYLIRAVRWKIDLTKADGLRLDAVKHVPDYFFGQQSGADKDSSDAGYLGGVQRQFNLTRGFSDPNHRDSVFDEKRPRDDAMVFGEHLGQPPGYAGYWDAGMRLVDNELRSKLNNTLGNPGATLAGLDAPGGGGFAPSLGVTHANSHDSDYAAQKEWQHAFYMTREGIGLIYSDGFNKAETLGDSGGAFPRHANTQYLGQFSDPRIPNIVRLHNDFARGLQQGRWGDFDYLAFERRDNRNPDGSTRSGNAADEITMVMMMNDNTAAGQARGITTSFPSGAYLYQYAEGPNGSNM